MEKNFDYILVSVKFFGVFFEFWVECKLQNETHNEAIQRVKEKFRLRFPKNKIQLKLIYEPYKITLC